jgi:hypothetical protein
MTPHLLDRPPTADERPYAPHAAQKTVWACKDPEVIVVGPADTGKTRTIFERIHYALDHYAGARILYCRKTRESCTDTGLVTYEDRVLPPGHYLRKGPKRDQRHSYKYTNGSELVVGGLDDMDKHRSSEYDWIYVQECSEATEDDWENLLRAVTGRAGVLPFPQLIGDMNPEDPMHWAHQRCDNGLATEIYIGHEDNPSITPERKAALGRMTGPRRQRYFLGRRVTDTDGSYYGALLNQAREDGRIRPLPPDPALPVYVSWDFGVSDFTTLWFFQVNRGQPYAIDYYEWNGEGVAYYARICQQKAQRFGYVFGAMVYPHDVEARVQAEIAETRKQMLDRLLPGIRAIVVPRVHKVTDRIEATRLVIPRMFFDNSRQRARPGEEPDPLARNTAQGIQRLIMYRRPYNKNTGTYGMQPAHDDASHAADGFGTFVQALDQLGPLPTFAAPAPYRAEYLG